MRHPVIITSLEEDFRNIGILPKEEAKPAEPEKSEKEGDLDEARVARRRAAGGKGMVRTQRATQKEKRAAKQYYRKKKGMISRKRKKMAKTSKWKRRQAWLSQHEGNEQTSRIANLLEDVQEIISTIDEDKVENAVKSFANVAIISEMLSKVFEAAKAEFEGDEAKELGKAAKFFSQLAEEAAGIATMLNEGVDEDTPEDEIPTYEDIEAKFQEHMDALIDGLELYADLTEDEDEESDPLEEEPEEEEDPEE